MSLYNDNNSAFTVKQAVDSSMNRRRINQPRGYSRVTGNKYPESFVCQNHTYEYYDCDWEFEGTLYRKGYYDENGEHYPNIAIINQDGSCEVCLTCDFCGAQSNKHWGKDEIPVCPTCGTRFNVNDIPHDTCVVSVASIREQTKGVAKILKVFFGIYFGIFALVFIGIIAFAAYFIGSDKMELASNPEHGYIGDYDEYSDWNTDYSDDFVDYEDSFEVSNYKIDEYDWKAFGTTFWVKDGDESSNLSVYESNDEHFLSVDDKTYKILDMSDGEITVESDGDTLGFYYTIYPHGELRFDGCDYTYSGTEEEILPHEVRAMNSNYDVITSKSDDEILDVFSRYNDDDAVYVLRSNNVIRMYQLNVPEDYEYDIIENIEYVTKDVFCTQMDNALTNKDIELSGLCDYQNSSVTMMVTIRDLDKYSSSDLIDSAIDNEVEALAYAWLRGIGYLED